MILQLRQRETSVTNFTDGRSQGKGFTTINAPPTRNVRVFSEEGIVAIKDEAKEKRLVSGQRVVSGRTSLAAEVYRTHAFMESHQHRRIDSRRINEITDTCNDSGVSLSQHKRANEMMPVHSGQGSPSVPLRSQSRTGIGGHATQQTT